MSFQEKLINGIEASATQRQEWQQLSDFINQTLGDLLDSSPDGFYDQSLTGHSITRMFDMNSGYTYEDFFEAVKDLRNRLVLDDDNEFDMHNVHNQIQTVDFFNNLETHLATRKILRESDLRNSTVIAISPEAIASRLIEPKVIQIPPEVKIAKLSQAELIRQEFQQKVKRGVESAQRNTNELFFENKQFSKVFYQALGKHFTKSVKDRFDGNKIAQAVLHSPELVKDFRQFAQANVKIPPAWLKLTASALKDKLETSGFTESMERQAHNLIAARLHGAVGADKSLDVYTFSDNNRNPEAAKAFRHDLKQIANFNKFYGVQSAPAFADSVQKQPVINVASLYQQEASALTKREFALALKAVTDPDLKTVMQSIFQKNEIKLRDGISGVIPGLLPAFSQAAAAGSFAVIEKAIVGRQQQFAGAVLAIADSKVIKNCAAYLRDPAKFLAKADPDGNKNMKAVADKSLQNLSNAFMQALNKSNLDISHDKSLLSKRDPSSALVYDKEMSVSHEENLKKLAQLQLKPKQTKTTTPKLKEYQPTKAEIDHAAARLKALEKTHKSESKEVADRALVSKLFEKYSNAPEKVKAVMFAVIPAREGREMNSYVLNLVEQHQAQSVAKNPGLEQRYANAAKEGYTIKTEHARILAHNQKNEFAVLEADATATIYQGTPNLVAKDGNNYAFAYQADAQSPVMYLIAEKDKYTANLSLSQAIGLCKNKPALLKELEAIKTSNLQIKHDPGLGPK